MAKDKNFERELPSGYTKALYINAKDAKLGIILNLVAVFVLAIVMLLAFCSLRWGGAGALDISALNLGKLLPAYILGFASMTLYIILHELVHGAAYKIQTGEKLTFGISWSCAFCGVPRIYTYHRTAIIAVASPLVIFTLIFIPLLAILYTTSTLYYIVFAFVFGIHLGGCSGDIYVLYLLLTKFRNKRTLMRDTGPEQSFFIPDSEND